jgi:WD40 repeat protein
LTFDEAKSALLPGLSSKFKNPELLLAEILMQTGGQPFLTQKLCSLVAEYADADQPDLTSVIQNHILNNWEVQDNPEHLKTIRDRLVREPDRDRLLSRLGLYQQLLQEKTLKFDNSDEQFQLLLTGLVTKKQNQLEIYNPIYKNIFNEDWLNFYLVDLYPNDYNNAKKAWLSSQKSSQYLLEGESLANAQIWGENKKLNSLDYQFLAASQKDQDERENKILQNAIKKAQYIVIGTLTIAGIVIGTSVYTARNQIQRANQITDLEKKSNVIQKNFSTNQLDSLLEAIAAGQNLKSMVSQSQSISDYPTVSPLSVLLSTMRKIEVKNEINLNQYQGYDSFNRFSQKGDLIVSIASPNEIQLWDGQGKNIKTVPVSTASKENIKIKDLEVSSDGQLIAVLMSNNTLFFFDQQGNPVNRFKYPKPQNLGKQFTQKFIRFSPDSKTLAIILSDQEEKKGQVQLWSMTENKAKMLTSKSIPSIQSLSFSPDYQSIAVGSLDGSIRIWQNTEIEPQIITAHNGDVNSLAFNFESKILASGGQDNCLNFWQKQGKTWRRLSVLAKDCSLPITDLKFSPVNDALAILRKGGQLSQLLEDASRNKFSQLISLSTERQDSYSQLFFSPDGQTFQSFQRGLIRVWQLSKPPAISRLVFLQKSHDMLTAIADNPQAHVTVLGDENGNFYLLNKKGEILQSIPGQIQSEIKGIFWLSDFQQLWTVTGTGLIEKWSYQNQKLARIKQLEYPQQVADVKFDSKTGNLFLLEKGEEGEKSKLTYFNLDQQNTASLQGIQTIVIPKKITNKHINKIAIQPNSPFIAILAQNAQNNDLRVWNYQAQKSYDLNTLNLNITHLGFSSDGKLLAISYQDNQKNGILQLWKVNETEGSELLTIAEEGIAIQHFDFRANNNLLKGIDANGYLQTYNFNLDNLLTQSCDWLKDYLELHSDKRKFCPKPK